MWASCKGVQNLTVADPIDWRYKYRTVVGADWLSRGLWAEGKACSNAGAVQTLQLKSKTKEMFN